MILTKGQSDKGLSSSWVILNAACEKAYQEQAYRDSAAIGLLAYLTASALEDHTKMFRSAQMTAFSYHFQGDTDSALAAYRLTLDCVIPGVPVSMFAEQDNPKLAGLDTDQNAAKTLMNVGVLCVNARKLDAG
jgi:hypothetical protein